MRIIEKEGVTYNVHTYDGGALSGVEVAAVLGQDADRVYKTLVTTAGAGRFYVFVVPVASELDLKKAAKAGRRKSGGNATAEISFACYGIHSRRLFACRDEETFSDISGQFRRWQNNICQRRQGRSSGGIGVGRSCSHNKRAICRYSKSLI